MKVGKLSGIVTVELKGHETVLGGGVTLALNQGSIKPWRKGFPVLLGRRGGFPLGGFVLGLE